MILVNNDRWLDMLSRSDESSRSEVRFKRFKGLLLRTAGAARVIKDIWGIECASKVSTDCCCAQLESVNYCKQTALAASASHFIAFLFMPFMAAIAFMVLAFMAFMVLAFMTTFDGFLAFMTRRRFMAFIAGAASACAAFFFMARFMAFMAAMAFIAPAFIAFA